MKESPEEERLNKLFVTNLSCKVSPDILESELKDLFEKVAPVDKI